MNHFDLEKFAGGSFSAQVNRELEKVTNNIQDPNTDATAVRKITVTISLKPMITEILLQRECRPNLHLHRHWEQ